MTDGEIREACGITQQTVADALGVTRAAVSHWECQGLPWHGPHGPAYRRVIAGLARHLEITEGTGDTKP